MPKTIVICASVSFYRKVVDIAEELEGRGFAVCMPRAAVKMKDSGDFRVETYKTRFVDASDYAVKNGLIRDHFAEVAAGDAVLVVNEEKHGVPGYVGGNVLMEMAVAMHLGKPIYVLNPISDALPVAAEVYGLMPKFLDGDLSKLEI